MTLFFLPPKRSETKWCNDKRISNYISSSVRNIYIFIWAIFIDASSAHAHTNTKALKYWIIKKIKKKETRGKSAKPKVKYSFAAAQKPISSNTNFTRQTLFASSRTIFFFFSIFIYSISFGCLLTLAHLTISLVSFSP